MKSIAVIAFRVESAKHNAGVAAELLASDLRPAACHLQIRTFKFEELGAWILLAPIWYFF
jgi:hypothetical protein